MRPGAHDDVFPPIASHIGDRDRLGIQVDRLKLLSRLEPERGLAAGSAGGSEKGSSRQEHAEQEARTA